MTTDTELETLIINKMTQAKYDELETTDATQLYVITDAEEKQATEEEAGVIRIATYEEVLNAEDDSTAMTPLKTESMLWDNAGLILPLEFFGVLHQDYLVFSSAGYELKEFCEYNIVLHYPGSIDTLSDDVPIILNNNNNYINIVNVLQDDHTQPITFGDMKQTMFGNENGVWRWLFKAWYRVTNEGNKNFLIPASVVNVESGGSRVIFRKWS